MFGRLAHRRPGSFERDLYRLAVSRRGSVRLTLQVFTAVLGLAFVGCSIFLVMTVRSDIEDGFTRIIGFVAAQFPARPAPPPAPVAAVPLPLPTVNGVAPHPVTIVAVPPVVAPPPAAAPRLATPPPPVSNTAPPVPPAQQPVAVAALPMPSVVTPSAPVGVSTTVIVHRSRNGHFYVDTRASGTQIPMMFDTGASAVSLRAEDAEHMGIDLSTLVFSARTSTANGIGSAAPYVIPSLTIGDITVSQVSALIHRRGALNVSLLGQSFMSRLAKFDVQGDVLTLQGR